jgi:putative aldouronate transport system substrate-binding protein
MDEHPEWKPEIYDPSPAAASYPTCYRDGIAISPTSKNWERCLMAQELLRTDKHLWDTSNYGIEGVHWEAVGDDRYKALPAGKNFPANGSCQWGWQTDYQRISDTMPDSYVKIEQGMRDNSTDYFLANGFAIDATNIKSVEAVMESLSKQYFNPLSLGAFEDPAATIAEWKQKMQDAGLDSYYDECKKQMAEYVARMK